MLGGLFWNYPLFPALFGVTLEHFESLWVAELLIWWKAAGWRPSRFLLAHFLAVAETKHAQLEGKDKFSQG